MALEILSSSLIQRYLVVHLILSVCQKKMTVVFLLYYQRLDSYFLAFSLGVVVTLANFRRLLDLLSSRAVLCSPRLRLLLDSTTSSLARPLPERNPSNDESLTFLLSRKSSSQRCSLPSQICSGF